ncbi:MAG: T9SS type A sorting domain-containing protein, partial [candidate division KSB1 bacterium]|nr:T9SS type A sorting domain-containing protein [candidate division KSB1 bacterium]
YSVDFTAEGVTFFLKNNALRLCTAAVGYGTNLQSLPRVEPTAKENRVEYTYNAIMEWYNNGPEGIQQGFTLPRPPMRHQELQELLTVVLQINDGWSTDISEDGRAVTFRCGGITLVCSGLMAVDAEGKILPAAFKRMDACNSFQIVVDDRSAAYPLIIDPFFQQAYLKASVPLQYANFGEVVDIDEDRVVIGTTREDDFTGAVYVFRRQGAAWIQEAHLVANASQSFSLFGNSVGISGDFIVVGAPGADDGYGAAYIFQYSNSSWTQIEKLSPRNAQAGENYGWAVAISNNTVLVGSYYKTIEIEGQQIEYAGAVDVYVYNTNKGTWDFQTTLTTPEPQEYEGFGYSLAIDGDVALIGAYTRDVGTVTGAGMAFIYRRNGSSWGCEATLSHDEPAKNANFGWSVSISGNIAVVGEPFLDEKGAAYVFTYSNGSWSSANKLPANYLDTKDFFGWSVAASQNSVVIGAWGESSDGSSRNDNSRSNSGAAYFFVQNAGTWVESYFLKAANCETGDSFGYSIAISGDYIIAGASGEDGDGSSPEDNSVADAGAAYVFKIGPSEQCLNNQVEPLVGGSVRVSWTRGNGDGCAVFVKEGTSGSAEPVDNTIYNASTTFRQGDQIGNSGWYCVYNGTGTSVEITGLNSRTSYRIHVCEYINGSIYYNTNTSNNNPITYETPIAVKLAAFRASKEGQLVRISWRTENEADLAGFALHAAESEKGSFRRISCDVIPANGGQARGADYVYWDETPNAEKQWYRLELIHLDGGREWSQPIAVSALKEATDKLEFALHPSYPNPFNAQTLIRFDLPEAAETDLAIYDARGRLVAALMSGIVPAGRHEVVWDGRDAAGNSLASGVYYCRLKAAEQTMLQKVILVK